MLFTANTAANLTARRLRHPITSVSDLAGTSGHLDGEAGMSGHRAGRADLLALVGLLLSSAFASQRDMHGGHSSCDGFLAAARD